MLLYQEKLESLKNRVFLYTFASKESDQIIRDAYGKIYEGNSQDQQGLKEAYLAKYGQHIFTKEVAAVAEKLTGRDLEVTCEMLRKPQQDWTSGHQQT